MRKHTRPPEAVHHQSVHYHLEVAPRTLMILEIPQLKSHGPRESVTGPGSPGLAPQNRSRAGYTQLFNVRCVWDAMEGRRAACGVAEGAGGCIDGIAAVPSHYPAALAAPSSDAL